ncbi:MULTISPECIES: hypothetical protein [unclassified Ensifer]|uniref:hypothetical protein n=1 Tax=unclassified Ensifer TaxID=2633371 RepID=UPI0008134D5B|nr:MULTISPECIES: hypothetical protein [unclassified Ensifer]OCO98903.1 hypothetical protein BC362_27055 [Ensifer sp. LC14]OCP04436.1 hypothetical protein BBX50_25680 [Ensifer sp. LC11]OCP04717.1 hypothetical protein BC374_25700 [Ensifer sp. LC13]OCP30541.1 hypothetical protein BC364_25715 [Ensifer sp. LC499]
MIRNSKRGRGAYGARYDDDLYATDPRSTTALELRDFGEEANSRLPSWGKERESDKGVEVADTYIMSNTNPTGYPLIGNNSHTGLFIVPDNGDPEGRLLYDPSGHYKPREMGSGDALYGEEVSPEDYLRYHLAGGPNATVRKFNTTPDQEAEIQERIDRLGGGGAFDCTTNVTEVIRGIGPFGKVEKTMWPVSLDNQLRELGKHVGEANDVQSLRRLMAKKGRMGADKQIAR